MDVRTILDAQLAGWRADAACRDEPDDLFLSDRQLPSHGAGSPSLTLALATCARCPVRRPCLREALTPLEFTIEHYRRT
ncbi:MAG TPA: WhiB family transcriptional regulator [Actinomycetota bacterium]|nr:WhiB family transcriptional regulator [Actinomycetota bacterium]